MPCHCLHNVHTCQVSTQVKKSPSFDKEKTNFYRGGSDTKKNCRQRCWIWTLTMHGPFCVVLIGRGLSPRSVCPDEREDSLTCTGMIKHDRVCPLAQVKRLKFLYFLRPRSISAWHYPSNPSAWFHCQRHTHHIAPPPRESCWNKPFCKCSRLRHLRFNSLVLAFRPRFAFPSIRFSFHPPNPYTSFPCWALHHLVIPTLPLAHRPPIHNPFLRVRN